jgi:hypothetical protein
VRLIQLRALPTGGRLLIPQSLNRGAEEQCWCALTARSETTVAEFDPSRLANAIEQAPQGLPPLDAGTNIPNPVYLRAHDDRVDLPTAEPALAPAWSGGVDWVDAGIGAGTALGALTLIAAVVALQRLRRVLSRGHLERRSAPTSTKRLRQGALRPGEP